jgi:oxygen-independent coproporphyrinogen-3 oxidase
MWKLTEAIHPCRKNCGKRPGKRIGKSFVTVDTKDRSDSLKGGLFLFMGISIGTNEHSLRRFVSLKIELRKTGFTEHTTAIFHLCKLFYEDAEITEEPADDAELILELEVRTDGGADQAHVSGKLSNRQTGENWTCEYEKNISGSEEARKRIIKRGIGHCVLHMFQQATGLEQPWGMLTGVRPTKLMHNLLMKHSREEAMQILREEHLVTASKAQLLTEIAERQLKVIPDLFQLDREASIYIGIPFCPTKCAYCTFPAYDIRGHNGSVDAFLAGLHDEIRETGRWLRQAGLGITTIYWGGGTPTSITAEQMDALFVTMHESFPNMHAVREMTVEAGRPDTITPEKIEVLQKWNVDRISINPQSFIQETLDAIGRHHTVAETVDTFKLSRRMGLHNINMDLIIGLPNEGLKELKHTLDETAKLMPESLTVHTLSFKRASRMTKNRDRYEVAGRDEIVDMMKLATDWTTKHGYKPYYLYRQKNILGNLENVGYALEGRESLYNIVMMEERQTIIGLGCGAVSKILFPKETREDGTEFQRIERFPNPKEPSVYNEAYRQYIEKKLKLLDEAYSSLTGEATPVV